MVPIRQTNFSSGELDPKLWGRTDLEKWASGTRRLRNFFVSKQGAAVSRPGTKYLRTLADNASVNERYRLVPYVLSEDEAYVLLFSHQALRLYSVQDDAFVVDPYTLDVPYDTNFQPDNWVVGETVTGGTSGATGVVVADIGHSEGSGTGTVRLSGVQGVFVVGETITGSVQGVGKVEDVQTIAGVDLVVATPYGRTELEALQWAQDGDVLVLAHESHSPRRLTRLAFRNVDVDGGDLWYPAETVTGATSGVVGFNLGLNLGFSLGRLRVLNATGAYQVGETVGGNSLTIPTPSGTVLAVSDELLHFTLDEVVYEEKEPYFEGTLEPMVVTAGGVFPTVPDGSHPAREWLWYVTQIARDVITGRVFETRPVEITQMHDGTDADTAVPIPTIFGVQTLAVYLDKSIILRRSPTSGLLSYPDDYLRFQVLADVYYRGRAKLFGFLGQTEKREYVDVGQEPDYAVQPPQGTNPFVVKDPFGTVLRTETPAAVAFFQSRLCYGGTAERSEWFFASKVKAYTNFDSPFPVIADSALTFALAARQRTRVRSYVPLNRLLIFTSSSVWSLAGQEGSPLAPDSVDAQMVEEVGAAKLTPLSVDGSALYVRAKGLGVRAIFPANLRSGYDGIDLTLLSQHLFSKHRVVDWTYAEDPWGVAWVVREDGGLLSLTPDVKNGVWSWARHDSPRGTVGDDTATGTFLNVCAVPRGQEDAVFTIVQRAWGTYFERFSSRVQRGTEEDGAISLDSSMHFEVEPTDTFTGLTHLALCEDVWAVSAKLDAAGEISQETFGPLTVSADGTVVLPETPEGIDGFLYVDIGLRFIPQLETLDLAAGQARTRRKTVKDVWVEVYQSRGLWAGQDFDHLDEWEQRTVAASYSAITAETTLVKVKAAGKWDESARAVVEQREPLPLTIVGLTREVEFGES